MLTHWRLLPPLRMKYAQPSVIPFSIGAIACGYLAGIALARPGRSRLTRAVVRSGSDNAYGIYLSHMLVITTLGSEDQGA